MGTRRDNAKKVKQLCVRVTANEYSNFLKVSRRLGLSFSEALRLVLRADYEILPYLAATAANERPSIFLVSDDTLRALEDQIRAYGTLLNQSTRALNKLSKEGAKSLYLMEQELNPIRNSLSELASLKDRLDDGMEFIKEQFGKGCNVTTRGR